MPKTKTVTLTITFGYENPEPQNGIRGGYFVEDWCENMEKLPTKTQESIIEYLTPNN